MNRLLLAAGAALLACSAPTPTQHQPMPYPYKCLTLGHKMDATEGGQVAVLVCQPGVLLYVPHVLQPTLFPDGWPPIKARA